MTSAIIADAELRDLIERVDDHRRALDAAALFADAGDLRDLADAAADTLAAAGAYLRDLRAAQHARQRMGVAT